MGEYSIPLKIKTEIFKNNLITIIVGLVLSISIFFFKNDIINFFISDSINTGIFHIAFTICVIISFIFLVVIPAFILISGYEYRRIERSMKEHEITKKELSMDYENKKAVSKIKIGDLCVYYKKMYQYYIVPIKHIFWVYQNEIISKSKKVVKSIDGTIKRETDTLSYKHQYNVILKTLYGNKITINCSNKRKADEIMNHFKQYEHILIGDDKQNKKLYTESVKNYKKMKKQKDKNKGG